MAVIIPSHYPARQALLDRRVSLLSIEQALRADIRPLRIGIINLMPQAERYEFHLLYPLGRSVIQVEPVWIRLEGHKYKSSDQEHLQRYYVNFHDAIAEQPLDGLILTGAPVEELPFDQVTYWKELTTILRFARNNIPSTLGICWGALALARMLDIEKIIYPMKVFGVFETRNLDPSHPITGDSDDAYFCPQSRHAGIDDAVMEKAAEEGKVRLLAHAERGGYVIFESTDHRYLMHIGHPEYEAERIATEYWRDKERGRTDVPEPHNLDLSNPLNRWRTESLDFFGQWIRYLYNYSNPASERRK